MGSQRVGHDWATKQQPLKQLMCPGNCIRNEQEERRIGRRSQCKKRKHQGSSLYYHQVVWQGWNSTYASSRNHTEIKVWALKLVTHLKGLAIHRGNTPASSCGWREVRRSDKIPRRRNILYEGNMERKILPKYLKMSYMTEPALGCLLHHMDEQLVLGTKGLTTNRTRSASVKRKSYPFQSLYSLS